MSEHPLGHAYHLIFQACRELGWSVVALGVNKDEDTVEALLIGTPEWIEEHTDDLQWDVSVDDEPPTTENPKGH